MTDCHSLYIEWEENAIRFFTLKFNDLSAIIINTSCVVRMTLSFNLYTATGSFTSELEWQALHIVCKDRQEDFCKHPLRRSVV